MRTARKYSSQVDRQTDSRAIGPEPYRLGFGSRFPSWSPGCVRATRVTSSGHLDEDLHLAGDLDILDYQAWESEQSASEWPDLARTGVRE